MALGLFNRGQILVDVVPYIRTDDLRQLIDDNSYNPRVGLKVERSDSIRGGFIPWEGEEFSIEGYNAEVFGNLRVMGFLDDDALRHNQLTPIEIRPSADDHHYWETVEEVPQHVFSTINYG